MKGYKPFGIPVIETESIKLSFEEYESIKMIDYKRLSQHQAAMVMDISRPTFTRIYNQALRKIAKAFVEGKAIEFDGGNYWFEQQWFRCNRCFKLFEGIESHVKCEGCSFHGANELINLTV